MKRESTEQFIVTREPSVAALSYALRHRETWPTGFEWNYLRVGSCAIGLADRLWGYAVQLPGLNARAERRIFINAGGPWGWGLILFMLGRLPTPERVADLLDEHMARVARPEDEVRDV